jgi:hypothetical protein
VIMSKVDFIFPISLTEAVILFSAAIPASSMIAEAVVSCLLRFFFGSLCTYSILCALEPFCFFCDNWGNGHSTNRCSDPTPLDSEGTPLMYSSWCIFSDGFALCLIWSFPLVLHSHLLMIIDCDVNSALLWNLSSSLLPWNDRYILLNYMLMITVCHHCLCHQVVHFWFWAHALFPEIALSDTLLVCDDFCFSGFFRFSLQLCALLIWVRFNRASLFFWFLDSVISFLILILPLHCLSLQNISFIDFVDNGSNAFSTLTTVPFFTTPSVHKIM